MIRVTVSLLLLFLAASAAPIHAQQAKAPTAAILDNYISTSDNRWFAASLPIDSPASIAATFDLFQRLGMRRIYWRGLQEAAWLETMHFRPENPRYFSFWEYLQKLVSKHPLDRLAVEEAHRRGMEIWGVSTLYDWGGAADTPCFGDYPHNSESRLRIEHPEWAPVDRHGIEQQGGPIELSYPEARRALVDLHTRLVRRDGYDGVQLITYTENFDLRMPDEFGYSPPAVEEFKKRTGRDPRERPFSLMAAREDWRRLRGEYVTAYLREMKAALAGKPLGICISPAAPHQPQHWPSGGSGTFSGLFFSSGHTHFDLEHWMRERIVDQLLVWGGCNGETQTRVTSDLAWMARGTATRVTAMTSTPLAERWEPLRQQKTPLVLSLADDAAYLLRCAVPEQPLSALTGDDPLLAMRALAQVIEQHSRKPEATSDSEPKETAKPPEFPFESIQRLASHPHLIVRRLALQALAKSHLPEAVPLLEKALHDPETGIHSLAALLLAENHGPGSADSLLAALARHPHHPLMETAVHALSRIQPRPAEALMKAAQHEQAIVRITAIRALAAMPTATVAPVLIAALDDSHRYARHAAAEALRAYGHVPAARAVLLAALHRDDPVTRNRAALSLGSVYKNNTHTAVIEARPQILHALSDFFVLQASDPSRADAAWGYRPAGLALLHCGPEGEAALRRCMEDEACLRLAQHAWKVLHIRHTPGVATEITEEQDSAAAAAFPRAEHSDSPSKPKQ